MPNMRTSFTNLVRLLCAVALLSLNFAHHPLSPDNTVTYSTAYNDDDEAAIYRLLVMQICSSDAHDQDGKKSGNIPANSPCHACRLTASLLPPPPQQSVVMVRPYYYAPTHIVAAQVPDHFGVFIKSAPRAPPLSYFI